MKKKKNALSAVEEENTPNSKADNIGFAKKDLYDVIQVFLQSIIIIALLFMFVMRFSVVNGASMNPTLQDRDWLILSNIDFQKERGDVIVVSQPNEMEEVLIKRIVALEGETVDITLDGKVTINGTVLEEPYVADAVKERGNVSFPHVVGKNCVFVMGDNRNHSTDSRYQGVGDVDVRYVVGEAKFRLFPFGKNNISKDVQYDLSSGIIGEINE